MLIVHMYRPSQYPTYSDALDSGAIHVVELNVPGKGPEFKAAFALAKGALECLGWVGEVTFVVFNTDFKLLDIL